MITVLWGVTGGLLVYGFAQGYGLDHTLLHLGPVVAFTLLANASWLPQRARSLSVALGLMTASAVFVHASHGLIEAHFAFFVFIVALTIYEDWLPFLIAVGFVLLHHGIMGMVDPGGVYGQPGQEDSPWQWAAVHAIFVAAAGAAGVIAWGFNEDVRRDIQRLAVEKEKLADQLEALAHEDWLTGLPNRRAWDQRLAQDLDRAKRTGTRVSVALLDVDGLKEVNDNGGHQAGDLLLKTLGAQWAEELRTGDFLARLGGDEFGLILWGCDENAAGEIVTRLRSTVIEAPWSVGSATWDGAEKEGSLLRRADDALYVNKSARRVSAPVSQS
ncbi:MAG: GGDEF domain-containing protein [Actinomycetota bacterium]